MEPIKPRLVPVTTADQQAMGTIGYNNLDLPYMIKDGQGGLWADADELRAWRELQSTSGAAE